ncbi:hypothetical protein [Ovoidimarina sediminis]|nr:hypothetical protein [Rhodophyticola sp. MJ-SS7]MDU8943064.1 hypothetical protein [Rhodophyticola sp. MJ-SS7]
MTKRPQILLGMAGGLLWSLVVLWIGPRLETLSSPSTPPKSPPHRP